MNWKSVAKRANLTDIQKLRAKQRWVMRKRVPKAIEKEPFVVGKLNPDENELLREQNAKLLI